MMKMPIVTQNQNELHCLCCGNAFLSKSTKSDLCKLCRQSVFEKYGEMTKGLWRKAIIECRPKE